MSFQRDLILKRKQKDEQKANVKPRYRSVICASDGSRTTGSPWADENNKVVWHQLFGSGGVGRARCETLVPELGLGVIVTPTDDKLGWEVVEDDPFLRLTATDNRNYQTIQPSDLQPGGRLMLWVDSRVIMPLAVYDTPGTLQINVISGYYPYNGVRTFFAGQVGYDLTSSVPGGGLTRYVGIYLDGSNTLQRINGATSAIGSTPAEPSWPAGAFRLAVVQLDNGQTSIDFADDIFDRRMVWSDEDSGGSSWPFDHILTVSSTNTDADFSTIALAIAGASAGDTIQPDEQTHAIGSDVLTSGVNIAGLERDNVILQNTTQTVALTVINSFVGDCTIRTERSFATVITGVNLTGTGELNNCVIEANNTHATGPSRALWVASAGNSGGFGVKIIATAVAGTATGIDIDSGTIGLISGEIEADVALDIAAGATVTLFGTKITGTITNAGTLKGWYFDSNGNLIVVDGTGTTEGVWLLDESALLKIKQTDIPTAITAAAASGDIIGLGPDTYTAPNVAGGITVDESLSIVGLSPQETIITRADDSSAVMTISDTPVTLRNLTVQHTGGTGAGTSTNIANSQAALVLDNVYVIHTVGTDGNHIGLSQSAGDSLLRGCKFNISGGTVLNYAIYLHTAGSTVVVEGGEVLAGQLVTAHASAILELRNVRLASGVTIDTSGGGSIRGTALDDKGRDCGKVVKNTSGATVAYGDVGYINEDGEFKTTTTANDNVNWHVVTVGGPNNSHIFCKNAGNATVAYTSSAPAAGDFLVTSTSAGDAQAQTTMRPEIFAVCLAAGSGGLVEALLLTATYPVTRMLTVEFFSKFAGLSDSDFVSTISGAPSGSTLVYGVVSSGNENNLPNDATGYAAKMLLWNTTRTEYLLIDQCNTGTNTITFTTAVPGSWVNGDAITIRSQTNTSNPAGGIYFTDWEVSTDVNALARAVELRCWHQDSALGAIVWFHPYLANSDAKRDVVGMDVAGQPMNQLFTTVELINRRFCMAWNASGSGTLNISARFKGERVAV